MAVRERDSCKINTAEVNKASKERREKKTEESNFYYVIRQSIWAERKEKET
jgi:hypothetical protein